MICIIHKILVLIKNHLNYPKDNIFECFFKKYNRLILFLKSFQTKKELNYTAIKDTKNLFRQEKETQAIKDRILNDIKNLFEHEKEEENRYKPLRVNSFWSGNQVEYESNGDINKIPSVEGYRNKIRPYLKDIINNMKKYDTWKLQLTTQQITLFLS